MFSSEIKSQSNCDSPSSNSTSTCIFNRIEFLSTLLINVIYNFVEFCRMFAQSSSNEKMKKYENGIMV